MSIQEEAERLAQLASSDSIPTALLLEAEARLDTVLAQAVATLGSEGGDAASISGWVRLAQEQINHAIAACQQLETGMHDIADSHRR